MSAERLQQDLDSYLAASSAGLIDLNDPDELFRARRHLGTAEPQEYVRYFRRHLVNSAVSQGTLVSRLACRWQCRLRGYHFTPYLGNETWGAMCRCGAVIPDPLGSEEARWRFE